MAKFDLKGLLNDRSVPDRQQDQRIVYRNPKDLIPSEENFYNTEKLERLKQSIKLLGILQPLLIENREGKDYVIAGHCRRKCCINLINEGNEKFSRIPCIYKTSSELEQDAGQEDDIVRQIMIIQANCYRDKSDWEKMTETLKMEELVKELREKTPMEGKTRDILKDLIGTSNGQLGRYHAISTNLCGQLMSEFAEDKIKISVAYEVSKLNKEYQKQACELYSETGILTLDDIKALYRQQEAEKGIPGQMSIETATGQNRPPEDDTEIPAETQIERFYESTNKNMKNYIIQEDKNMAIFMLSNLYGTARVRNGHLNYQGSAAGITFNPGGVFEHELSWQSLAKILIGKHGHKKPVKMVSVDTPEKKKDNEMPGPAKCITGKSNSGICGAAAYCDTEYKCCAQCPDDCNSRCGWLEESCQSVAETPDEKQHDFAEDTKIANHSGKATVLPIMKNNDQRKEWLRNYKAWGVWYEDKNIGVKYYKYDFENGARLIVEEYGPDPRNQNSWWVSNLTESHYMHLVGGPEPEHKNNIPKWTYHTRYNKFPNSESELVEFLKELQK